MFLCLKKKFLVKTKIMYSFVTVFIYNPKYTTIMKQFLNLLVMLVSFSAFAQDYKPLVQENYKWECVLKYSNYTESKSYPYTIELKGDTIINEVAYKQCFYTFADKTIGDNVHPIAFLREDLAQQKVYCLYNEQYEPMDIQDFVISGPIEEILLYDFANIANPDQFWCGGYNLSTDSVEIAGRMHRFFALTSSEYYPDAVFNIIEGVGFLSANGLLCGDLLTLGQMQPTGYPKTILEFHRLTDLQGNLLYDNTRPPAAISDILSDKSNNLVDVFDITGTCIARATTPSAINYPPGIYIIRPRNHHSTPRKIIVR